MSIKQWLLPFAGGVLITLAVGLTAVLYIASRVDYSANIHIDHPEQGITDFRLLPVLQDKKGTDLHESFPYDRFLDSANIYSVTALQGYLADMDSVNPGNPSANQEILSIAFTEKMLQRVQPSLSHYNPDTLLHIIQWAEKFNDYAAVDAPRADLYQVIYDFWLNTAGNNLRDFYTQNPRIKFNYKFRYLADRLREKQFIIPVKGTDTEKVIQQLIAKNWTYLFNKFWHSTGLVYKAVVFFIVLLVLLPYLILIRRSRKRTL